MQGNVDVAVDLFSQIAERLFFVIIAVLIIGELLLKEHLGFNPVSRFIRTLISYVGNVETKKHREPK